MTTAKIREATKILETATRAEEKNDFQTAMRSYAEGIAILEDALGAETSEARKNVLKRRIDTYQQRANKLQLKTPTGGSGGPELTSVEDIHQAAVNTAQQSKASTERMKKKIAMAEEIGGSTIDQLDQQTAQMKRIQDDSTEINNQLDKSKALLKEYSAPMKTWAGNLFGKKKKKDANSGQLTRPDHLKKEETLTGRAALNQREAAASRNKISGNLGKKSGDMYNMGDDIDKDGVLRGINDGINEDLAVISSGVDRLDMMAKTMGNQLKEQEKHIKDIDSSVDENHARMKEQNIKIGGILKKGKDPPKWLGGKGKDKDGLNPGDMKKQMMKQGMKSMMG